MSETQRRGIRLALKIVIVVGALLFAAAVGLAIVGGILLFQGSDPGGEEIVVTIEEGATLRSVSRNLAAQGLARNAGALELYGRFAGLGARLQAGEYLVSGAMSPGEILRKIAGGDAVFDEIQITIPEGWSLDDIEHYVAELGLFSVAEFQTAAVMQEAYRDFAFLSHLEDDTILDGYLFPDTYRVFRDSTPVTVVRRMLANFGRRVVPVVEERVEDHELDLHELLTLASIVQDEAGNASEMPAVAGVFTNRLRENIRLESDATVNYVLGTNKRQPTFADTEVDDPYNTYENYGLPPGPIGNPGLDAIRASLDPARHDFYFFLHPLDRPIVLSRTFAEHLENKRRYLD